MRDRHNVLIAAGGHATRISAPGLEPKCLMRIGDQAALDHLLRFISVAQKDAAVLVATNRIDYSSSIRAICNGYGADLITDPGFSSTVQLALFADSLMEPYFAFFYGHAFVKSSDMTSFLDGGEAVASYAHSTRREPIISMGRYLEPPFRVHAEALRQSMPPTWGAYWREMAKTARCVRIDSPHEPNFSAERAAYEKYWLSAPA
jgi:hypothetical protein